MSTTTVPVSDNSTSQEDNRLAYAHGTVMAITWMVFASTGILFARYGRLLRIGSKRKVLGEFVWFQAHRLTLSVAAFSTLLGFFLVLAQATGSWVSLDDDGPYVVAHSILGIMIVGFALIQIWMALFRCHPISRFRFIFNWLHRSVGLLAFVLSIPTIFLIISTLTNYQSGLYIVMSIWTGWTVFIFGLFEILTYLNQRNSTSSSEHTYRTDREYELRPSSSISNNNTDSDQEDRFNQIKLILLGIYVVIAIALVIPFIILIWQQN
ncbi:unnamed protein product [Adineta ricciae]|uniref:Cytochrome b561 domain-containing protein n=1 Tax=Adineta ricciae TaxID=249248 RepID=A0A815J030_ADIRI|nr:unnamed protein product [Adineta ricciae]CAF1529405.1 unnamed protein product [Adineta ricciae]